MINNFEFSDAKQVRKTLLITSFVGISFKILVKNSTGDIEMLGFKIPAIDASVIPQLVGYVIIFEMIALIIRYSDEDYRDKYSKYIKFIKDQNMPDIMIEKGSEFVPQSLRPNYTRVKIINKSVYFLDIVFPLLLGIYALVKIFFF